LKKLRYLTMGVFILCMLVGSLGLLLNETAVNPARITWYRHMTAAFGTQQSSMDFERKAPVVFIEPKHGCGHILNKENLKGAIVVVRRGGCAFMRKAYNVERWGGVGMVVGNYVKGEERWRLIHMRKTRDEADVDFPCVFVSKRTYDAITASVIGELQGTAQIIITREAEEYPSELLSFSGLITVIIWLAMIFSGVWAVLVTLRCFYRRLIALRQRKLRQALHNQIPEVVFTEDLLDARVHDENCNSSWEHLINNSCPICLENFEDQVQIKILPCEHGFHSDCINP